MFARGNLGEVSSGKIIFITWKNKDKWPIESVSENIYEMLHFKADDLIEKNIFYYDLVHPEDIKIVSKEVNDAISSGLNEFTQTRYRIKDFFGKYHYIYDHTKIIWDENNVIGFCGYIFDETDIIEERERLSTVLEGTNLGLWDWYPKTNEVYFDERWTKMLGYEQNEVKPVLESWVEKVHPDDIDGAIKDIQDHIKGKTTLYNNVHRMLHKKGHWVYILDRGKIVSRDNEGNPIRFSGTHTDITDIKKIEKLLQEKQNELENINRELEKKNKIISELADRDGLTGVYNRRKFDEKIIKEWERYKRNNINFTLLMVDIDYFKKFNDTYGHQAGDKCLKNVAKILEKGTHRKNDFVARYGGEEFIILLSDNISLEDSKIIAQKLCDSLKAEKIYHIFSDASNYVSISIGLASTFNLESNSKVKDLIYKADKSMYKAKSEGRNRVCSID